MVGKVEEEVFFAQLKEFLGCCGDLQTWFLLTHYI
jgi:hypothetical protein